MTESFVRKLQLDDCLEWIIANNFKRVIIQLKKEHLKLSPEISAYLQKTYDDKCPTNAGHLDLYMTQANTCCIDLLVTQHVSEVDAVIHIGNVCLSKPHIKKENPVEKPTLFAFGQPNIDDVELHNCVDRILKEIQHIRRSDKTGRICIFYDSNLIQVAYELSEEIETVRSLQEGFEDVHIADLFCPDQLWETTPSSKSKFISNPDSNLSIFKQYLLKESIDRYSHAIYIGDRLSIQLILEGPSKISKITLNNGINVESINVSKVLNRRMALVGRLKDQDELRVGVLVTNPLPNLDDVMKRLKSYAEPRKHMLYFISMIQTIDECKIGNFDLCDAFIVINSCTCSTILESLVFNRPIITELEFKLACGFEAEYGRVLWPGSSSHLSEDDMINKRKVSDVALALIHTRNELLERCSQARSNKWSGLEYGFGSGKDPSESGETRESLVIAEGLTGIASTYSSEPLRRETKPSYGGGPRDDRGEGS